MKRKRWEEEEEEEVPEAEPQDEPVMESVEITIKAEDIGRDSHESAKGYIDSFFADKMMHCGGKIPKRFLHDKKRVSRVVNYSISKGVKRCYIALKPTITPEEREEAKRKGDSTSDIKLVNETLKMLARARIPQQYAGGMLVMYLEFVEGVSFK